MKKLLFITLLVLGAINILAQSLILEDKDGDGINDAFEQALAERFAPELRFNKKLELFPVSDLGGSDQNINEENWPCSVEYITNFHCGVYFEHLLKSGPNHIRTTINFNEINKLQEIEDPTSQIKVSDSGITCGVDSISLTFDENLYGEPISFPTYFHCNHAYNGNIVLQYFVFAAYNNAHSPLDIGDHLGDWMWVTLVIENVDVLKNNLNYSRIQYAIFDQHGQDKEFLYGESKRLRYVNNTHIKVYPALGSHEIYPEPGILIDLRIPGFFDVYGYDDFFMGNGLIVQSWNRALINLGEIEAPMPNTQWLKYRGQWGDPQGPACRFNDGNLNGIVSWDEWITNGYLNNWHNIYLDCYEKFSLNYVPDPNYNCVAIVNWRNTCNENSSSDIDVYNNLSDLDSNVSILSGSKNVGVMPGNYPNKVTVKQKMILKAIEGIAILGHK